MHRNAKTWCWSRRPWSQCTKIIRQDLHTYVCCRVFSVAACSHPRTKFPHTNVVRRYQYTHEFSLSTDFSVILIDTVHAYIYLVNNSASRYQLRLSIVVVFLPQYLCVCIVLELIIKVGFGYKWCEGQTWRNIDDAESFLSEVSS